jgi:putative uncharacterized protein ps504
MSEKELTIYEIPDDTQYWLVRADGGKYYEDFKYSSTISLQDNDLTLDLFDGRVILSREMRLEYYKEKISNKKAKLSKQQVSIIAKKMFAFISQMKIGDIIIVPSHRTQKFMVGVITSDAYELSDEEIKTLQKRGERLDYCVSDNKKRRKVKWLNEVPRRKVNSNFLYTLTMHQSIINVTESSEYITPLVSPIYIQNNKLTLCVRVNTPKAIDSETWQSFYAMINELKNKEIDEKVSVKSNVESPGYIIISSALTQLLSNPTALMASVIIGVGALFGNVEFQGIKITGIIPGIIQSIKMYKENNISMNEREIDLKTKELEYEERKMDHENKKKDQQVADLERDIKIKKLSKEVESMDLSLDNPTPPNVNGFQMQMDFDDFESEE